MSFEPMRPEYFEYIRERLWAESTGNPDHAWFKWARQLHHEAELMKAQRDLMAQALWDVAPALWVDTDMDPNPNALIAGMGYEGYARVMRGAAKQHSEDIDEMNRESDQESNALTKRVKLLEVELREAREASDGLRPGNLAETMAEARRIGMADGWDEAVAKSASLLWGRENRHKNDQDLSAEIGAARHEIRREANPYR